jgi:hypothetical protein
MAEGRNTACRRNAEYWRSCRQTRSQDWLIPAALDATSASAQQSMIRTSLPHTSWAARRADQCARSAAVPQSRRVLLFADDALEAHGAGALMDLYAASLQVLDVEDAFGCVHQQLSKHALPLAKPHRAQIESVEIEQVEGVIEQPVPPARGQIGVHQPEIGNAARVGDDGLAIQDQVLRGQSRERVRDRPEALLPVVAPPCVDGRTSVSQVRLGAVAVELDLVDLRSGTKAPPRAGSGETARRIRGTAPASRRRPRLHQNVPARGWPPPGSWRDSEIRIDVS